MEMENIENAMAYVDYNDKIQIDSTMLIIAVWNRLIAEGDTAGCEVFPNDREFFSNFETLYDVAWAASNGSYRWSDRFAYFSSEGHLMSFTGLGDIRCPIDLDMFDVCSLVAELQELQKLQKMQRCVSDISPAIHNALQEI